MVEPDDPLKRAASALAKASGQRGIEWSEYLLMVRVVVEALDTPTAEMINAGNLAMRDEWAAHGMAAPPMAGDAAVCAAWEAMLKRLLGYNSSVPTWPAESVPAGFTELLGKLR